MPEISRFLGIVIRMYYKEPAPPHFHAEYGEYEITLEIQTGIVEGRFPLRALSAVTDWYLLHKEELMHDWRRASQREPLQRIDPLE